MPVPGFDFETFSVRSPALLMSRGVACPALAGEAVTAGSVGIELTQSSLLPACRACFALCKVWRVAGEVQGDLKYGRIAEIRIVVCDGSGFIVRVAGEVIFEGASGPNFRNDG